MFFRRIKRNCCKVHIKLWVDFLSITQDYIFYPVFLTTEWYKEMYYLCMATTGQQSVNFSINFCKFFCFFALLPHRQITDRGESAINRTQTGRGGIEPWPSGAWRQNRRGHAGVRSQIKGYFLHLMKWLDKLMLLWTFKLDFADKTTNISLCM